MKTIKGRRILLIGGAGFIGHSLALRFNSLGAEVSVIDSLQVNNFLNYISARSGDENGDLYRKIINQRLNRLRKADVTLHIQDCRDYHLIQGIMDKVNPDVVIHLAAVAHADKSNRDPYSTFDHSFRTLENSLDCSRERNIHFIYFSSSMVYGDFKKKYVVEGDKLSPKEVYGTMKLAGEIITRGLCKEYKIPYNIIRPSAVYGPTDMNYRVSQYFL